MERIKEWGAVLIEVISGIVFGPLILFICGVALIIFCAGSFYRYQYKQE